MSNKVPFKKTTVQELPSIATQDGVNERQPECHYEGTMANESTVERHSIKQTVIHLRSDLPVANHKRDCWCSSHYAQNSPVSDKISNSCQGHQGKRKRVEK